MIVETGRKVTAARVSIFSNLFLVFAKLIVGFVTSSVSVLSEAVHSGIDLVASGIAFFSVRRSDVPPDQRHAFGHGKIENISGFLEALLIFVAALLIVYEAVEKLLVKQPIRSLNLGISVMGLSAVINLAISLYLLKTARETDSMALEADAHHLLTDVYTSVGVMMGLLLIRLTGIVLFDPLMALGVAILITRTAYTLTRKSLEPLLDAKLPDEEEELVASIIRDHSPWALEFHSLRTRKAGSQRHIDLHLVVQKDTHVEEAHQLCDDLESHIQGKLPNSVVSIHIEPDESSQLRASRALIPPGRPHEEHENSPS